MSHVTVLDLALQSYQDCEACSRSSTASQCIYCRRYVCEQHADPRRHNCQAWEAAHPSLDFKRMERIRTGNKAIKALSVFLGILLVFMALLITPAGFVAPQLSPVSGAVSSLANEASGAVQSVLNWISPQVIDDQWMSGLMSLVNSHSTQTVARCPSLDAFAKMRFTDSTAGANWEIMNANWAQDGQSFYASSGLQVEEEVLHPDGYTASQYYSTFLARSASAHGLTDGLNSAVGYYIGTSPTVKVQGACISQGTPRAGVDIRQFYSQYGCSTSTGDSTWVVVEVATGCAQ